MTDEGQVQTYTLKRTNTHAHSHTLSFFLSFFSFPFFFFFLVARYGAEVYHRMIEELPRLMPVLDLLRAHPNVKVVLHV
jgi:hypothetical protein